MDKLKTAALEILSWNVNDTSVLLTSPPKNAGLFHAQRVLREAMEKSSASWGVETRNGGWLSLETVEAGYGMSVTIDKAHILSLIHI